MLTKAKNSDKKNFLKRIDRREISNSWTAMITFELE